MLKSFSRRHGPQMISQYFFDLLLGISGPVPVITDLNLRDK